MTGIIETIKMLEREEGRKEGIKEGIKEVREEVKSLLVKNLLVSGRFTIPEIANFIEVSQAFVRKVKKNLK